MKHFCIFIIKQIIKKGETDKYFTIKKNLSFGEKLVEQNYLNKGQNFFQNIHLVIKCGTKFYEMLMATPAVSAGLLGYGTQIKSR